MVGERNSLGGIDIIGVGSHPSLGLSKGVVINIDDTVQSIGQAVREAEMMAGVEIASVFTGIAGGHIKSLNSDGIVPITSGRVEQSDIDQVIDAAKTVPISQDREVIHVIPQEYKVDQQGGIQHPLGMSGVRLVARVHIVTAAVASARNIVQCCSDTGLNVTDIVLQQLASSEACLTEDEKDLGVMLLDIGGGTTDMAIFVEGAVVHTHVLALGGDHITSDIAYGLRAPLKVAEQIKQRYGSAMRDLVDPAELFEVPQLGGEKVSEASRRMLSEIIEPRVEEMFMLIREELLRWGDEDRLPAGLVLTGGSTLMPGMVELAERVFGMPVRLGVPREIGGLTDVVSSPIYSTGVGLVKVGLNTPLSERGREQRYRDGGLYKWLKSRMGSWLQKAL